MNKIGWKFFKNKRVIVIAAVILVLAAAVTTVCFLLPGKSAREFYFEAESRNFKKYADQIKNSYKSFYTGQEPYMTGIYKRRMEVTADIGSGNDSLFGLKNAKGIFDLVKRLKLVADTKTNTADKTSMTVYSLLLEKTPFIDAEFISKDNRLLFTVPVLTPDRYFSINKDRIDEVYDRFKIPVKPKKALSLTGAANTLKFDSTEFDGIAADFGGYISQFIGEKDVKYGKNVDVVISGRKTTGREVSVTLDGKKCSGLLKGLAAKAGSDETLLKLTYGNFADLIKMLDDAGVFQLIDFLDNKGIVVLNDSERNFMNAVNIKKDIDGFKKKVEGAFNGFDSSQGLEMTLVVDKSGNILDRKASMLLENIKSGTWYNVDIHSGSNSLVYNDSRNRFLDITLKTVTAAGKNYKQHMKLDSALAPPSRNGDGRGSVILSFDSGAEGAVQSADTIRLDFDSSIDALTLKKTNAIKYDIEMKGTVTSAADKMSGTINTVSWENNKLKTKNRNTSLTLNADLPSFGIKGLTAVLNLNGEDKFGLEPFTLPEAQASNTVDLNTATDAELEKVQNEILASFGTFYITNKPIIDAVLGK